MFFALSFIAWPIKYIIFYPSSHEKIYEAGEKIKNNYHIKGNIASNDWWGETLALAFYTDSRYYGTAKNDWNDAELQRQLKNYDIDYYFVWDASNNNLNFLKRYKEITGDKIFEVPLGGEMWRLKIYSLKEEK